MTKDASTTTLPRVPGGTWEWAGSREGTGYGFWITGWAGGRLIRTYCADVRDADLVARAVAAFSAAQEAAWAAEEEE